MYCPGCCKAKTACWCKLANRISYLLIAASFIGTILSQALRNSQ